MTERFKGLNGSDSCHQVLLSPAGVAHSIRMAVRDIQESFRLLGPLPHYCHILVCLKGDSKRGYFSPLGDSAKANFESRGILVNPEPGGRQVANGYLSADTMLGEPFNCVLGDGRGRT